MKKFSNSVVTATVFAALVLGAVLTAANYDGLKADLLSFDRIGGIDQEVQLAIEDVEVELASGDVPGDGFEVGDNCGYITGTADVYAANGGQLLFDYMDDREQGCVAETGYFYKDGRLESKAYHSILGEIDFTWSRNSSNYVYVDPVTGYWSGYAKMAGVPGPISNKWLWMDWTCDDCSEADYMERVHTDPEGGDVQGFAWSDYLYDTTGDGYVLFDGLQAELAPVNMVMYVDILSDEGLNPDEVTIADAPLADGYEYWRARVQFLDVTTGEYWDEGMIDSLQIFMVPTTDSNVWLDQITNMGDAIEQTSENPSIDGCSSDTGYCLEEELDGSVSYGTYVFSGAPTSDMTGIDDDDDDVIETLTDRDGCKWIYSDQWSTPGDETSRLACDGADYDKADVFYARNDSRNSYAVDYVEIVVTFDTDRAINVSEAGDVYLSTNGSYIYDPDEDVGLSFRPRYQVKEFYARYSDGEAYTSISSDEDEMMDLVTKAKVADISEEFAANGNLASDHYTVYYQLEVDSESDYEDPQQDDLYLLMDSDEPVDGEIDNTIRTDITTGGASYSESYIMGYDQLPKECLFEAADGTLLYVCDPPENTVSNPTAEQWVCDYISEDRHGGPSCYFTAYLPIPDRHVDPPEGMLMVSGTLNSTIDAGDLFADDDAVSIQGSIDVLALRDKMLARIARYTLGMSAGSGALDSRMEVRSGSIRETLNGRLLYATGDVEIDGSTSFTDKTLVVFGDVYAKGNITGGKLGVVALESGGVGGNLFVYPEVTDLHVNAFLDGSVFSYSGEMDATGSYPVWDNDETRIETLGNQLYWKGSISSRNTVGGSDDIELPRGDGTIAASYDEAVEFDLVKLRQLRQCYGLSDTGEIDTSTWGPCGDGELVSGYVDPDTGLAIYNASIIIDYDPSGDLPIFVVESGLFY